MTDIFDNIEPLCADIFNINLRRDENNIGTNYDEVILTISKTILDKFPLTKPSQLDLLINGITRNGNNGNHKGYLGNKILKKLNNNKKYSKKKYSKKISAKIINDNADKLKQIFDFIQDYIIGPLLGDIIIFDQRITHQGADKQIPRERILVSFGFGKNNIFTDNFEKVTIIRQNAQNKKIKF